MTSDRSVGPEAVGSARFCAVDVAFNLDSEEVDRRLRGAGGSLGGGLIDFSVPCIVLKRVCDEDERVDVVIVDEINT